MRINTSNKSITNTLKDMPQQTFPQQNLPLYFTDYDWYINKGQIEFSTIGVLPTNNDNRVGAFQFAGRCTPGPLVILLSYRYRAYQFAKDVFGFLTYNGEIYDITKFIGYYYDPVSYIIMFYIEIPDTTNGAEALFDIMIRIVDYASDNKAYPFDVPAAQIGGDMTETLTNFDVLIDYLEDIHARGELVNLDIDIHDFLTSAQNLKITDENKILHTYYG